MASEALDQVTPDNGSGQLDIRDDLWNRIELVEIEINGRPHLCALDINDESILTTSPLEASGKVRLGQNEQVLSDAMDTLLQKTRLDDGHHTVGALRRHTYKDNSTKAETGEPFDREFGGR